MDGLNDTQRTLGHWYVVHCQPLRERQAANQLTRQLGLTVYLPEVICRFRGQLRHAPLFPRYLFVRANLQDVGLSRINSTIGVVRLVAFGAIPQVVPVGILTTIEERVEQIDAQGGLPMHTFRLGDRVQIKKGPLSGLEAIFQGPMKPSERVRILIELLGRPNEIELAVDMLERGGMPQVFQRERQTRGKGRPIRSGR
jgi:transcriptional antiterminator RfaH